MRNALIDWLTPEYRADPAQKNHLRIQLKPVLSGVSSVTEIVFLPGRSDLFVVLQKDGRLSWFDNISKKSGLLLNLEVETSSEQGLLGLAFSPHFYSDKKLYLHYSIAKEGKRNGRISEWTMDMPTEISKARLGDERILLEVEQPYANHNGGRLEFGPDGYLYIAFGDGGWRGDPHGNGQNPATLLGSILRIDPHPAQKMKRPYTVPLDNPGGHWAPEVFAIGLRNPWKFSFAPDGRLIAADVGQDDYEELSFIRKGGNYGWNIREGFHCYEPKEGCSSIALIDPFYEYSHGVGRSITGGFVYSGSRLPALSGYYVFGDFVAGWIKALRLPPQNERATEVIDLGRWPILISTFARSADGELFVADYGGGVIYQLVEE